MINPYRIIIFTDAEGNLTKKIAGILVKKNRAKHNSKGGTPSRPTFITTKLKPQTRTTKRAKAKWGKCMRNIVT
jgi:hypothetical protein